MAAIALDIPSLGVGVALGVLVGMVLYALLLAAPLKPQLVNHTYEKSVDKVVHKCPIPDIEEMATKSGKPLVAFCRCWKSGNMPYCDGSHAKHNKETGDNCGPLLVELKKSS